MQNYLMINESTKMVDNVCVWDGNTDTWTPPPNTLMLIQATTPALVWFFDSAIQDYVLKQEMGAGAIGFTWNGTACVTNDPKPEVPVQPVQPATSGTQEL